MLFSAAIVSLSLLFSSHLSEAARINVEHKRQSRKTAVVRRASCRRSHPPGSPTSNTTSPSNGSGFVKAAWYSGWNNDKFPLSAVPWDRYTHLTYSFGITTNDGSYFTLQDSDKTLLPQFVSAAHAKGVKALLSIGGWTGSQYFSDNMATDSSRKGFVKAICTAVTQYNLDGIDFDWEYPNGAGIGCNTKSADDTANYLKLLQLLRADPVGKNIMLTAATYITPFNDASGSPSSDVSQFAKYLTYIAIMNYDIWGSWSSGVGPNAPLADACAGTGRQSGSATSAVAAWNAAGMPKNQIVLGVASYGHSFTVAKSDAYSSGTTLASYPPFSKTQPVGDSWDVGPYTADQCGNPGGPSGEFNFRGLVNGGWLTTQGTVASGYNYRFDSCSKTAYIYSPAKQQMVSYDDAPAMAAKGKFIKDNGMAGFATWEAAGDYKTILIDAISQAL